MKELEAAVLEVPQCGTLPFTFFLTTDHGGSIPGSAMGIFP
jgi:hypothetical protein